MLVFQSRISRHTCAHTYTYIYVYATDQINVRVYGNKNNLLF